MVATRTERAELCGARCGTQPGRPARRDPDPLAAPVENVFVASRVRSSGLEQASLGCPIWGYERDGVLRALCHAGSNLVPVNADEDAVEAWAEFAGPQRMCASIIGPSDVAMTLWRRWPSGGVRRGRRPATSARTSR